MEEIRTCLICGEKLTYKQLKYCSRDCAGEGKAVTRTKYTCDNCGEVFRRDSRKVIGKHKYCSNKCANQVVAKKRTREEQLYTHTCEYCGKVRERMLKPYYAESFKRQKYCSQSCSNRARSDERRRKNEEMHTM